MGYLFLAIALAFGIIKVYCGKRTSSVASCIYNSMLVTTVRMVMCFLIGILIVLISGASPIITDTTAILIAFVSGVSIAAFTTTWLLAVRTNAYMIVEVFVMGGVIIPTAVSSLFYGEHIGAMQMIGICLLLVAVYCISTYRNSEKIRLSPKALILLILTALASGISDFSQKLYVKEVSGIDVSVFNLYTYLFAAISLLFVCLVLKALNREEKKTASAREIVKPIFFYILIMAVCLFLNSYFKTRSAQYLDAVLLYPLYQSCATVLALLMSVLLFREKMTAKGIFGIVLSIVAVCFINLF